VPVFSSNNLQIDLSTFDVRLKLGQILSGDDAELKVVEVAYVFVSHEHFLAFAGVVGQMAQRLAEMRSGQKKPTD